MPTVEENAVVWTGETCGNPAHDISEWTPDGTVHHPSLVDDVNGMGEISGEGGFSGENPDRIHDFSYVSGHLVTSTPAFGVYAASQGSGAQPHSEVASPISHPDSQHGVERTESDGLVLGDNTWMLDGTRLREVDVDTGQLGDHGVTDLMAAYATVLEEPDVGVRRQTGTVTTPVDTELPITHHSL